MRTVAGYLLLLEHCADPAKDFIDFKPGTSPDEITALRARAESAEADASAFKLLAQDYRVKISELEGALEAGQRNCDDVYNDLRAERDAARTEAEAARAQKGSAHGYKDTSWAMARYGYSKERCSAFWQWIKANGVPYVRLGLRKRGFDPAAVEAFDAKRRKGEGTP